MSVRISLPEVLDRGTRTDLLETELCTMYSDMHNIWHLDPRCGPENDESDYQEKTQSLLEVKDNLCPDCWLTQWGNHSYPWLLFVDGIRLLVRQEETIHKRSRHPDTFEAIRELWSALHVNTSLKRIAPQMTCTELEPWEETIETSTASLLKEHLQSIPLEAHQGALGEHCADTGKPHLVGVAYQQIHQMDALHASFLIRHAHSYVQDHLLAVLPENYLGYYQEEEFRPGMVIALPEEATLEILLGLWNPRTLQFGDFQDALEGARAVGA